MGVLQIGTNATALAMNFKNITVSSGATFKVNTASITTHTLTTQGNIVNNGTINFNSGTNLCNVVFNKNGNQSITGTATFNNYNRITVDLGLSINNTLDIESNNFSAATVFFKKNFNCTTVNISVLENNGKILSTNDYFVSNTTIFVPFINYAAGQYYISVRSAYGIKTFKIINTK